MRETSSQLFADSFSPDERPFSSVTSFRSALSEGKQDFLGQCYMQLEIGNKRVRQFFTPYEVSLLVARLTIGDPSHLIAEQGFITLHEPACGSGGMVIAVAQVIEEAQHDPSTVLYRVLCT